GLKGAGDSLFHNNGDGTFTDVSKAAGVSDPNGYYGLSVVWADFNNTGRPDVYIANDSTPKFLYKNLGNGKFQDIGLESGTAVSEDGSEQASMGIGIGDYLHTGGPSLYVTNFSDENDLLFRNDGNWNFTDVSYASGVALPSLPFVKWGTAFVDLVIGDIDGTPMILRNHGVSGRHWVSFELAGTKSNRLAIGARIKVTAGGITQTDEIHSGGSYLSQNDLRLHFGLGSATKIDHVEIFWPSGKTETLAALAADQFYSVLEGSSIVAAARIRPASPAPSSPAKDKSVSSSSESKKP